MTCHKRSPNFDEDCSGTNRSHSAEQSRMIDQRYQPVSSCSITRKVSQFVFFSKAKVLRRCHAFVGESPVVHAVCSSHILRDEECTRKIEDFYARNYQDINFPIFSSAKSRSFRNGSTLASTSVQLQRTTAQKRRAKRERGCG